MGLAQSLTIPNAWAIIIAAGETKATVVKNAVEGEKHVLIPASALQNLPNARFYLTMGAAKGLLERQYHLLAMSDSITDQDMERIVIDLAVNKQKRLTDLKPTDFESDRFAKELLRTRPESPATLASMVRERIIERLENGARTCMKTRFLHTEPHHDDIMLGYLAAVVHDMREPSNKHVFSAMTSGFTAVTNAHLLKPISDIEKFYRHTRLRKVDV